jgi:hypothetical protein
MPNPSELGRLEADIESLKRSVSQIGQAALNVMMMWESRYRGDAGDVPPEIDAAMRWPQFMFLVASKVGSAHKGADSIQSLALVLLVMANELKQLVESKRGQHLMTEQVERIEKMLTGYPDPTMMAINVLALPEVKSTLAGEEWKLDFPLSFLASLNAERVAGMSDVEITDGMAPEEVKKSADRVRDVMQRAIDDAAEGKRS